MKNDVTSLQSRFNLCSHFAHRPLQACVNGPKQPCWSTLAGQCCVSGLFLLSWECQQRGRRCTNLAPVATHSQHLLERLFFFFVCLVLFFFPRALKHSSFYNKSSEAALAQAERALEEVCSQGDYLRCLKTALTWARGNVNHCSVCNTIQPVAFKCRNNRRVSWFLSFFFLKHAATFAEVKVVWNSLSWPTFAAACVCRRVQSHMLSIIRVDVAHGRNSRWKGCKRQMSDITAGKRKTELYCFFFFAKTHQRFALNVLQRRLCEDVGVFVN